MSETTLHVAIDCRKAGDLGIGRYIRGLTSALDDADDSTRFTLLVDPRTADRLPQSERFTHLPTSVGHYRPHEPFVLGRIIDDLAPDLFHAPHYVFPVSGRPGVVTIHDVIHLGLSGPRNAPRRLYARLMIDRAVRRSREILTVSEASAGRLVERWPEARARITVTPNGIDERFFGIERRPDDGAPLLLYVGNDKPHKNLDRLVAAWQMSARPAGARLVIAGSMPERFREIEGVTLAGHVSDEALDDLYGRATALILPSLEEGFGLPAAEAMAAGVPVLASRIPSLIETTFGEASFFDPRDLEAMSQAIGGMLQSAAMRADLSVRSRTLARRFRWAATASATLEIYRRAARG